MVSKESKKQDGDFYLEYKSSLNKQRKIKEKYAYLQESDSRHLASDYILAQAKELCSIINNLKQTPFKALSAFFKEKEEALIDQFYITTNEYGEYIPDVDRIDKLILPEAFDEEQDEIEKRASRLIDK